jgi:hypothetical protein
MPRLRGRPIHIRFLPSLRADRGRLRSGGSRGEEVHAGSFILRREIVLESDLASDPSELARVLAHELFHFAWLHAGNPRRRSYESLLKAELDRKARGELGWSSEYRKQLLSASDILCRTRRWREYACESFCDSAAWLFAGLPKHEEFTLPDRFRRLRRRWFETAFSRGVISI